MADLPSDFWSGWIAMLTVFSLAGLAWLVFSVYFSANEHEESPVWDDTLSEGSNPAPMWWFWLILIFMVFCVVYLMLYPGLGSYRGAFKWSQGGQLGKSYALYRYEFQGVRQQLLESPIADLQADQSVMKSAKGIFNRHCAACHGPDGAGQASIFPNLTDEVWQWGGDATEIEHSIRLGRQAVMPAWGAILGDETTQQLAHAIESLSTADGNPEALRQQVSFQQYCVACHGPDGKGNSALGAPDLTGKNFLYGGDQADLSQSIANGRQGLMPSFDARLDDVQIRMLVAWLTREPSDSRPGSVD